MLMEEAHIWLHVPEEEPCTPDTTNPPGSTGITGAQDDPAAHTSQRSLRQHQQKTQKEMHLCSSPKLKQDISDSSKSD